MSVNQELTALVQRLEAVATRLEGTQGGSSGQVVEELIKDASILKKTATQNLAITGGNMTALRNAIAKLEISTSEIDCHSGVAINTDVNNGVVSPIVVAYDEILSGPFKTYCELSQKIGGDVATHGAMVEAAFQEQRQFLVVVSKSKKPAANDLQPLLLPTSTKIQEIQEFREKNRRSIYFNHLSAISESIPALGWVTVSPAPAPYVNEMKDAGQFYTNRVLKDSKDSRASKDWKATGPCHTEWTKAWVSTVANLQVYVKQYHTTGLVWNPKGGDTKAVSRGSTNGTSGGPPAPPPPPPPPPPGLFDDVQGDSQDKARGALFDELNKGEEVSKGLKKVTDDMKTHKNPGLRGTTPVPPKKEKSSSPPKYGAPTTQKPPKFGLEGKKWIVEYQRNNPGLVIEETEVNQSVYIFKCDGSTINVKGKVNAIILDSCKKTAVVFTSVVSACEFINCQSVQMQVMETVPTISVEKTDGCQMYLSKDARPEIISAKSSEMNVVIPTDDDEFVEQPVPEQFKTTITGTKLNTKPSESV